MEQRNVHITAGCKARSSSIFAMEVPEAKRLQRNVHITAGGKARSSSIFAMEVPEAKRLQRTLHIASEDTDYRHFLKSEQPLEDSHITAGGKAQGILAALSTGPGLTDAWENDSMYKEVRRVLDVTPVAAPQKSEQPQEDWDSDEDSSECEPRQVRRCEFCDRPALSRSRWCG
uniref:Protein phosphatase inhibitor 2 n=1 Tax=Globodera pallida TaxID=36090 RepID=A0A183CKN0_GLOPA